MKFLRPFALFIVSLIFNIPAMAQVTSADKIVGEWVNEEKNEIIEIYKNGEKYFGKLIWDKELLQRDGKSYPQDNKNPDSSLRHRNLYMMDILLDFHYQDGQWEDGRLYDPKSGRTYSCLIRLNDKTLQIRGYVGVPLLGRSSYWQRNL